MHTWMKVLARSATLVFVAAGCGSSAASPPPATDAGGTDTADTGGGRDAASDVTPATDASTGPTAMAACAAFATVECGKLDTCTGGFILRTAYGDMATCMARVQLGCVAALGVSGTATTPAGVMACTPALQSESCADALAGNRPAMCPLVPGSVANGAPCQVDGECQSGACQLTPGMARGVCAAPPMVGSPCGNGVSCGHGLACTTDTMTCATAVAMGGTCDPGHPCAPTLQCVGATPGMRTCQPYGTMVGTPCDSAGLTAPGCNLGQFGLYCPRSMGTCTAVTPAAPGTACNLVGGGFAVCTAGGRCTSSNPLVAGTCAAPAADGAACDLAAGPGCLAPARCVTTGGGPMGTCRVPGSAM